LGTTLPIRPETLRILKEGGLFLTSDALEILNSFPETLVDEVIKTAVVIAKQTHISFIDKMIVDMVLTELQKDLLTEAPTEPVAPLESVLPIFEVPNVPSKIQLAMQQIRLADKPLEGYIEYFRDRYTKINRIFTARGFPHIQIARLATLPEREQVNLVGMVRAKREIRDRTFIDVEDLSGAISIMVPQSADAKLKETARLIIEDSVCAFTVKKMSVNIVQDIVFPEIPFSQQRGGAEEVYAILTSDTHFGSKSLVHSLLSKFEKWLKGEIGDAKQREIASKTKYIVLAGDLAEGIGVYPEQLKDLEIVSIQDQYETAANYLSQLPQHIEIIIGPGNHDATQQALPQPFPSVQVAPKLYDNPRIHLIPNPCMISIHGVKILVYHGQAIEDIAQKIAGIKITEPAKAMEYMLKIRHLAPVYGGKTPIAPQIEDSLVIQEVPQILLVGHIHVFGRGNYRGTILIGSGAWQKQTDYQVKLGIVPTPGIVAAVNLKTLEVTPIDLNII
jgi:DNA polymerase II small subunit